MERPKVQAFLAAIRHYPNIGRACQAAGIHRSTHYRRYEKDQLYRAAFDRAWRIGCGRIMDRAIDFVYQGIPEPIIYQGEFCYDRDGKQMFVYNIPERLLSRVLAAEFPEKYNVSHLQAEVTGKDGAPLIPTKIVIQAIPTPNDTDSGTDSSDY